MTCNCVSYAANFLYTAPRAAPFRPFLRPQCGVQLGRVRVQLPRAQSSPARPPSAGAGCLPRRRPPTASSRLRCTTPTRLCRRHREERHIPRTGKNSQPKILRLTSTSCDQFPFPGETSSHRIRRRPTRPSPRRTGWTRREAEGGRGSQSTRRGASGRRRPRRRR